MVNSKLAGTGVEVYLSTFFYSGTLSFGKGVSLERTFLTVDS
jgi:hypothetical protein